ncbi:MAG: hypothetical protein ABI620_10095 [Chloroflexota bacterium]
MRSLVSGLLVVFALSGCAGSPPPPTATNLDSTGILLVGVGEQVQAGPPNEAVAQAYNDARIMAEANGVDLGYPWIDSATGELVLSAATGRGRQLLQAVSIAVPHRIREVAHGYKVLEQIKDDATFLGARGVEGAQLIFMTVPDHRDNRALIVISEMSRPLLDYLAAHYPPDAIAIQVDPMFGGSGAA